MTRLRLIEGLFWGVGNSNKEKKITKLIFFFDGTKTK